MIICIYDVTEYGSCMIDDLLFDMLDDNSFEMIFWNYYHSLKKDCADRPFEITFFSSLGQHNLWKQFVMFYVLIWYMTIVCKWAGKIFVHKIIFVRNSWRNLLTKIHRFLSFSYRKIYFLFNNCSVFLSRLSMLNWKDGQLLLTARFRKVNVN